MRLRKMVVQASFDKTMLSDVAKIGELVDREKARWHIKVGYMYQGSSSEFAFIYYIDYIDSNFIAFNSYSRYIQSDKKVLKKKKVNY